MERNKIAKTRICTECGKRRPLDAKHFGTTFDYLRHVCRRCLYERAQKWRKDNKERYDKQRREADYKRYHRDGGVHRREVMRVWMAKNKDRLNKAARERALRFKIQVLSRYSDGPPSCSCCGETAIRFLTADHMQPVRDKALRRMTGNALYQYLKNRNYPSDYQVMCFNCNIGRMCNGGVCPHVYGEPRRRARKFDRELRELVLRHYSRGPIRCRCCGESHPDLLSIDHINGGGKNHRKSISVESSRYSKGCGGIHFYRWLRDQGFPSGYRVLCFNCNCGANANGGVCPHKDKKGKIK